MSVGFAARRGVGDGLRQGAVAEKLGGLSARGGDAGGEIGLEVDIERRVGALAKGGFHGAVGRVGRPSIINGVGIGFEVEGYVRRGVCSVEDSGLEGQFVRMWSRLDSTVYWRVKNRGGRKRGM